MKLLDRLKKKKGNVVGKLNDTSNTTEPASMSQATNHTIRAGAGSSQGGDILEAAGDAHHQFRHPQHQTPHDEYGTVSMHYAAIYGERPDLGPIFLDTKDDEVLQNRLAIADGNPTEEGPAPHPKPMLSQGLLHAQQRAINLSVRNSELQRRIIELESEADHTAAERALEAKRQQVARQNNNLVTDSGGQCSNAEATAMWAERLNAENEQLHVLYEETTIAKQGLVEEMNKILEERKGIEADRKRLQEWAAGQSMVSLEPPPMTGGRPDAYASRRPDYSVVSTAVLALEDNVFAVVRELAEKHRIENSALSERQREEISRLADGVLRLEAHYLERPTDIDALACEYAQLLPRSIILGAPSSGHSKAAAHDDTAPTANVSETIRVPLSSNANAEESRSSRAEPTNGNNALTRNGNNHNEDNDGDPAADADADADNAEDAATMAMMRATAVQDALAAADAEGSGSTDADATKEDSSDADATKQDSADLMWPPSTPRATNAPASPTPERLRRNAIVVAALRARVTELEGEIVAQRAEHDQRSRQDAQRLQAQLGKKERLNVALRQNLSKMSRRLRMRERAEEVRLFS